MRALIGPARRSSGTPFLVANLLLAALLTGCTPTGYLAGRGTSFDEYYKPAINASHSEPTEEELPKPADPAEPVEAGSPAPTAVGADGVSLAELEQLALEQHPAMIAAAEEISAAEGRAWQVGRYRNPVVGAASPQLAGSESQYNTFISQDVLTGGKLALNTAAAYREVEQAKLAYVRARFDVLTNLRRQFYSLLATQQRLETLEQLEKLSQKSSELGQSLLRSGEGAKPDVLILEVEADKVELALLNEKTTLIGQRRQLAAAIGHAEMEIGLLSGELSAPLPDVEWSQMIELALATNPQIGIAGAELERTRILLDRAIVEPKPTLNFMGGYQHQVSPIYDQAIFQVTMTVPLWDRNQGGIQAASAHHRKAHADFQKVRLSLAAQSAEALQRFQLAHQQVEKYTQDILPKTKESIELTQKLYIEGQADFLDLLAIQRTQQEVNLSYIDAQEARWSAAADLANLMQVEKFP